jgi:hypothetical protein
MGIFVTYKPKRIPSVTNVPNTLITATAHTLIINGFNVQNKTNQTIRFNLKQTGTFPSNSAFLEIEEDIEPYGTLNIIDKTGDIFLQYTAATTTDPEVKDSLVAYTNAYTQICDCFLSYTTLNETVTTTDTTTLAGVAAAISMSNNATATTSVTSTFKKALGTTTSSFATSYFTVASNRITYNGISPIDTLVNASISVSHDVALGAVIGMSVFKNGVKLSASSYNYQLSPTTVNSLSVNVYAQLSTADYLEVWINLNSSGSVLVTDMNFTVIV